MRRVRRVHRGNYRRLSSLAPAASRLWAWRASKASALPGQGRLAHDSGLLAGLLAGLRNSDRSFLPDLVRTLTALHRLFSFSAIRDLTDTLGFPRALADVTMRCTALAPFSLTWRGCILSLSAYTIRNPETAPATLVAAGAVSALALPSFSTPHRCRWDLRGPLHWLSLIWL